MDLNELISGAEAAVIIRETDGERRISVLSACPCQQCLQALAEDLLRMGARLEQRLLAAEAIEAAAGAEAVAVH